MAKDGRGFFGNPIRHALNSKGYSSSIPSDAIRSRLGSYVKYEFGQDWDKTDIDRGLLARTTAKIKNAILTGNFDDKLTSEEMAVFEELHSLDIIRAEKELALIKKHLDKGDKGSSLEPRDYASEYEASAYGLSKAKAFAEIVRGRMR